MNDSRTASLTGMPNLKYCPPEDPNLREIDKIISIVG